MVTGITAFVFAILALATVCTAQGSDKAGDSGDGKVAEVSYAHDILPIVRNFCTTCHAGEDPEGGFVLTSYAAVREHTEEGELLARIEDEDDPMPQSGLLPKPFRRLFHAWAKTGYKKEGKRRAARTGAKTYALPEITPLDLDKGGFEFLAKMQGHWVGSLQLMGQRFPWFAFDYRAIAPSHVHGIFEGGTIGNLFTSFFAARYRGKRVLMARNGGVLNGIYRTSYFVLQQIRKRGRRSSYRFVDALGGAGIMWMDIAFEGDKIEFSSYTSRFGFITPPKLHMRFVGRRLHPEIATRAAKVVGFPDKKVIALDLPKGLPKPDWGDHGPVTSASYMWQKPGKSLIELGKAARDPMRIDQIPHLSKLTLQVRRGQPIRKKKLLVYLSRDALTDADGKLRMQHGYLRADVGNGILMFSEIAHTRDSFTFTYLHPGVYYLTVIADVDGDDDATPGDFSHASRKLEVKPESHARVRIDAIDVRN